MAGFIKPITRVGLVTVYTDRGREQSGAVRGGGSGNDVFDIQELISTAPSAPFICMYKKVVLRYKGTFISRLDVSLYI